MIVFRCASECDIANMIGIDYEKTIPRGHNTFNYEKDTEYRHFFYFYDSAIAFMELLNMDRFYDKYSVIMAFDIDEELLKSHIGLGEYNMNYSITSIMEDDLFKEFKKIYFPEFAIPKEYISKEMIVGIGNKTRITPVRGSYFFSLSKVVNKNQKDFLNYVRWLFEHGTELKEKEVLSHIKELFPIEDNIKRHKLSN